MQQEYQEYLKLSIYTGTKHLRRWGTSVKDIPTVSWPVVYESMDIDKELAGIPKLEGRWATLSLYPKGRRDCMRPSRSVTGTLTALPGGSWRIVEQVPGIYTEVTLNEVLPGADHFLLQVW